MPDTEPIRAAIRWWCGLSEPWRCKLRAATLKRAMTETEILKRDALTHLTAMMDGLQKSSPSPEDAARQFGQVVQDLLDGAAPPPLTTPVRPPMPDPDVKLPGPKFSVSDEDDEDYGEP